MELKDLDGKHILGGVEYIVFKHPYGDESNGILVMLDNVTYQFIEDPSDGYRSYMREIEVVELQPSLLLPNIKVHCVHTTNDRGAGGEESEDILTIYDRYKPVLRIGTANTDDYYPYFVMDY